MVSLLNPSSVNVTTYVRGVGSSSMTNAPTLPAVGVVVSCSMSPLRTVTVTFRAACRRPW